jgi:hypothetical protein
VVRGSRGDQRPRELMGRRIGGLRALGHGNPRLGSTQSGAPGRRFPNVSGGLVHNGTLERGFQGAGRPSEVAFVQQAFLNHLASPLP